MVGPNGEMTPIVSTQTAYTQVRVPDGDTMVIAGLVRRAEARARGDAPQPDAPADESEEPQATVEPDKELLIFVTPRIIGEIPRE